MDTTILGLLGEELTDFAHVISEEETAWRALAHEFCEEASVSQHMMKVCPWCGAFVPAPLMAEHMHDHKATSRRAFERHEATARRRVEERLLTERAGFVAETLRTFSDGRKLLREKELAKAAAKAKIVEVEQAKRKHAAAEKSTQKIPQVPEPVPPTQNTHAEADPKSKKPETAQPEDSPVRPQGTKEPAQSTGKTPSAKPPQEQAVQKTPIAKPQQETPVRKHSRDSPKQSEDMPTNEAATKEAMRRVESQADRYASVARSFDGRCAGIAAYHVGRLNDVTVDMTVLDKCTQPMRVPDAVVDVMLRLQDQGVAMPPIFSLATAAEIISTEALQGSAVVAVECVDATFVHQIQVVSDGLLVGGKLCGAVVEDGACHLSFFDAAHLPKAATRVAVAIYSLNEIAGPYGGVGATNAMKATANATWRYKGCGLCSCGGRCDAGEVECPICLISTREEQRRRANDVRPTPKPQKTSGKPKTRDDHGDRGGDYNQSSTASGGELALSSHSLLPASAGEVRSSRQHVTPGLPQTNEETLTPNRPVDILAAAAAEEETDSDTQEETEEEERSEQAEGDSSEEQPEESDQSSDDERDESPPRNEDNPHADQFSHGSVLPRQEGGCCPVCRRFNPQGAAGTTLLRDHLNTVHTEAQRTATNVDDQIRAGMVLCRGCNRFVKAPNSARNKHVCGVTNRTRTENMQAQRQAFAAEPWVTVWTDGGSVDGTAGAAAYFGPTDRRLSVTSFVGPLATNQRAELLAVVLALRAHQGRLIVLSDSQWVVNGFQQINSVSCHVDLWDEVLASRERLQIRKVAGHTGVVGNEVADALSKGASGALTLSQAVAAVERLTDTVTAQIAMDALSNMTRVHPLPTRRARLDDDRLLEPEEEDQHLEFIATMPATHKALHKKRWARWLEEVMRVLRGYSAASASERYHRQMLFLELPRKHLRRPTGGGGGTKTVPEKEAAAVESLVRIGAVGRASMKLASTATVAKLDPSTLRHLARLHPQEGVDLIPAPAIPMVAAIPPRLVHKAIVHQMARGAAASVDGWTRELLLPIAQCVEGLPELTILVEDILGCNVSAQVAQVLRAGRLVPLQIGDKIRPVAVESAIAKLASLVGLSLIPESVVASLGPIQKGVGGNVEMVATNLRDELRRRGCGFLFDGENAYNAVSRNHVLREVYGTPEMRPLWGVVRLLLGCPGSLGMYNMAGKREASLASSRGIRQGMILGPLLFALAVRPILAKVQHDHPTVQVVAYLDDVSLVGDLAVDVAAAATQLVRMFAGIGVVANATKCHWVDRDPVSRFALPSGQPVQCVPHDDVVKILGVAFVASGNTDSASKWLVERAHKSLPAMQKLRNPFLNPQAAVVILQQSLTPRMIFYVRTHVRQEIASAATWFDDNMMACLKDVLKCPVGSRAETIARLPVREGGLGLTSMAELSQFAYECRLVKDAQKKATATMVEHKVAALISSLSGPEQLLRLSHASKWSARIARDGTIALPARAATIFLKERLMIQVANVGDTVCACGARPTNQHVMCCEKVPGGAKIQRHDGVVDAIAKAFTSLGMHPRTEPRMPSACSRARPDILVESSVTDVTIRFPAPASVTSARALAAADRAAEQKWAQWRGWAERRDLSFAPLVFETSGAMLDEGVRWIRQVVGEADCLLATQPAVEYVVAAALAAVIRGNVGVYAAALG
jgi:ribonuclease HI